MQATTGGGGWPLSVFLSPDLKPVYGGTYFPPRGAYGRPGFPQVLQALAAQWETEKVSISIVSSFQFQGKLVPKLILGPFLTLSVRNGPNLQS